MRFGRVIIVPAILALSTAGTILASSAAAQANTAHTQSTTVATKPLLHYHLGPQLHYHL